MTSENNKNPDRNKANAERRNRLERRKTGPRSMYYALISSRRRELRRDGEAVTYYTDWYGYPLFLLALSIVLLCVMDAFLTLELISMGANELNPIMAFLLDKGLYLFVGTKMALTVAATIVLVMHQRFALFRRVRALHVLLATFGGYCALIAYELTLLFPSWA